jgi:hypothetical protein
MDNPEKLAILGTKDIGGRQTKPKTHHRKLRHAVLQLEFEKGRVPAKGRAFLNDKKGT